MNRKYLSPKEVEEMTGVASGTLANWRLRGKGPVYIRVGRLVRYRVEDLDDWMDRRRVRTMDIGEAQ